MIGRRRFLASLGVVAFRRKATAQSAMRATPASDLGDLFAGFRDDVRAGNVGAVERAVTSQPALLFAHDPDDVSLYRIGGRSVALTRMLEARGYRPDALDLASSGDRDRLIALLDSEPRATGARSHVGETALHAAAAMGQIATIGVLLARGADVNAVDWRQGETPLNVLLRRAPTTSLDPVGTELLNGGADPRIAARDGTTPLHGASAAPPSHPGGAVHSQRRATGCYQPGR